MSISRLQNDEETARYHRLVSEIEDRTTAAIFAWLKRPENADLSREAIERGVYGGAWRATERQGEGREES